MKVSDIEVTYLGGYGSDLTVVNAARVSFHKESSFAWDEQYQEYREGVLKDGDVKLINYLAKHKHFSPFNHAFLSFRVKAPIFVARQLVKHKFMPWNEVSRRYVDEEPEFYVHKHQWRLRAENVKQGSSDGFVDADTSVYVQSDIEQSTEVALSTYKFLLSQNVAPEQARMVLPQNTMTEWIWSGTLGAFLDMLVLRLDLHTQHESRIVAQKIAKVVEELFPISYTARIKV